MKKWLVRLLLGLVVLIILASVSIHFFLDSAIKRGVETVGPMLAKVEIKLESVSLSLLSGAGKIKGLVVGNPEGFKTPSAIQVSTASLSLQPSSLLGDKVVIHSINVQGPEITYETDLKNSNLKRILANLDESTGGGQAAPTSPSGKPARKLQVDDFVLSGAKWHLSVSVMGGHTATLSLPDIHLTGLGQGPDGITPAELTKKVLQAIEKDAAQAASGAMADLGKSAGALGQQAGKAAESVTKDIGNLFKKK